MKRNLFSLLAAALLWAGCDKDDKQVTKPRIKMESEASFPKNCATVYRGESFEFNAVFTDEEALGNYNLEIHHNFDHHSHSTDGIDCASGEKKSPFKPFVYNKDFSIPNGKTSYNAVVKIDVPGDIDTGDYHLMVRVTNRAAWQEVKGIGMKIADR